MCVVFPKAVTYFNLNLKLNKSYSFCCLFQNESESCEEDGNVDVETVEELSEKINLARLKATASRALASKQL